MNPFEEEDDETQALIEVLPNLAAGDRVVIHDADCPAWDDERCACSPIVVHGPSGKA